MLIDVEVADRYAWLYSPLPTPDGTWDHVVDGALDAYAGIKAIGGAHHVMFRGSTTFLDWVADFAHLALPFPDEALGPVHGGFRDGVALVKDEIDEIVGDDSPLVVAGHSLGAGHAALYAGYRRAAGKRVDALVLFGEPKAGMGRLADLLADVPIRSYRNADAAGHDLVTDVPYTIPGILDYEHPRALIDVSRPPPPNDAWSLFAYHHFGLYCAALGAVGPAAASLST